MFIPINAQDEKPVIEGYYFVNKHGNKVFAEFRFNDILYIYHQDGTDDGLFVDLEDIDNFIAKLTAAKNFIIQNKGLQNV